MAEYRTDPDDRSAAALEREVNEQRARVSENLDALQAKASMEHIVDEVVRAVRENGGDIGRNLGRQVRENPLPVLLTGVGLAWLMASSGRPERVEYDWEDDLYDPRYRGAGSEPRPLPGYEEDEAFVAGASDFASAEAGEPRGPGSGERAASAAAEARERAAGLAAGVRERAAGTAEGLRERASGLSEAAQGRLSSAGEAMHDAGHAMRVRAERARRRAAHAGHGAREGFDTILEEQPLVLGALAFAVGAAIGGALPSSRAEDRMFGTKAEQAKRALRELAEEEGHKVKATAEAVAEEARSIAGETAAELEERLPGGKTIVEEAEARLTDAATRLQEAGTREAERQNLTGGSKPSV